MFSNVRKFLSYGETTQGSGPQFSTEVEASFDSPSSSSDALGGRSLNQLLGDTPVDWDAVMSRLEACPRELAKPKFYAENTALCAAIERDAPLSVLRLLLVLSPASAHDVHWHTGSTPLFLAVSRSRSDRDSEVTQLILEAYPPAARRRVFDGFLPLHAARDAGTAKLLLEAFPAAVGWKTGHGCLPLHRVVYGCDSDAEVARILIEEGVSQKLGGSRGGGGVFMKDQTGVTPLEAVFRTFALVFDTIASCPDVGEVQSVSNLSLLSPLARRKWDKLSIVVEAAYQAKARDKNLANDEFKFRILHSVIELGAPDLVIQYALFTNRHQCMEYDELGRSALCVAAARKETPARIIAMLLDPKNGGNLSAAGKIDKFGRLPLHYAIASGRPYDNATKAIIKAAPQALQTRDSITHLYPFMMAAVGKHSDINWVYNFLTEVPDLVQPLAMGIETVNQQVSTNCIVNFLEARPALILLPLAPIAINIIVNVFLQ